MTADELLAVAPYDARRLFPGTAADVAARFRQLALAWHPDRNAARNAAAVFAHISALHRVAEQSLADDGPAQTLFETIDGRQFRLGWRVRHVTDYGEILIGDRHIAQIVPKDLSDLAKRADDFRPRFADDEMKAEMSRALPDRIATLDTAEGHVFVESKAPDQILMRDLLRLGPIDPRHVAWMATRLVNIACWLQWAGVAHGAIGPETLLVSPANHSVALTGPFLCAGPFGSPPAALPERTLACAPRYAASGAVLDERLDPDMVRLTLRELLGDPAGVRLTSDPDFSKPFASWLMVPPEDGARSDFAAWERARDASFGARRFVNWDVDIAALMAAPRGA
jgi:hypothetical protein